MLMPLAWVAETVGSLICVDPDSKSDSVCTVISHVRSMPDPFSSIVKYFPADSQHWAKLSVISVWLIAVLMARYSFGTRPTLGRKEKKSLQV